MAEEINEGSGAHSLTRKAAAKINLYLHITDRRPDGYHELDSLAVFAGVHDVITLAPADTLTLDITGPFADGLEAGPENLALKAAERLQQATGLTRGCAIGLQKNLPVSSGIGGGSADAAAVLDGLMDFWKINPKTLDLHGVALELGADVPVCLYGRGAYVSGIGDEIVKGPPLPDAWLVLVNPGVSVSTPDVFKARKGSFNIEDRLEGPPTSAAHLAQFLSSRYNDLTEAAISFAPAIGAALAALKKTEGCLLSRMSGSGATCFGIYDAEDAATIARSAIVEAQPGWWVQAAPLLDNTRVS